MGVTFESGRLAKLCNKQKKRAKKFGHQRAKEIKIALDDLQGAPSLAEIDELPQWRLHALSGDQAGGYSIDIDNQYRIWFRISGIERIRDGTGYVDFSQVTSIEIYFVGDPHD